MDNAVACYISQNTQVVVTYNELFVIIVHPMRHRLQLLIDII